MKQFVLARILETQLHNSCQLYLMEHLMESNGFQIYLMEHLMESNGFQSTSGYLGSVRCLAII